jgi:hypothetical protein
MSEGAVYVGRPSRWGNPFLLSPVLRSFPSLTVEQAAQFVVNDFRFLAERGRASVPSPTLSSPAVMVTYPSPAELRHELAGKDLVCWCPLDEPCHADVLLQIANGASS